MTTLSVLPGAQKGRCVMAGTDISNLVARLEHGLHSVGLASDADTMNEAARVIQSQRAQLEAIREIVAGEGHGDSRVAIERIGAVLRGCP